MRNSSIAMAVAVLTVLTTPLKAQTGLYVGAQMTGASLHYKDAAEKLDFGSGFGVHAGITLGSSLGLLANYDKNMLGSMAGDTDLGQWDLLARLGFIGIGPVKTFITGGITGRVAKSPAYAGLAGNYDFTGINPTGGAAAQVFVTSKLAIDGSVLWTFGRFSEPGFDPHNPARVSATGSRVSVGASWYLLGGK